MILKLTLKANTKGILITILGLCITITKKSGGKMTKNNIFSYFSLPKIYKSTRKYK